MTYADDLTRDRERRENYERGDRALRHLADLIAESLRAADVDLKTARAEDVVLVIAARGTDLNEGRPYLLPAATLDEAARVLAALPQIRGGRR